MLCTVGEHWFISITLNKAIFANKTYNPIVYPIIDVYRIFVNISKYKICKSSEIFDTFDSRDTKSSSDEPDKQLSTG